MTFSIVAVDRESKEVGLAIASCCWDAGQVCMAKAEVGAIASQASGNMAFLSRFFDGLSQGSDPAAILTGFKKADGEIESRQIGMISYDGNALAFTGTQCSLWAGHKTGKDYACQGNTLFGPQVVNAMAYHEIGDIERAVDAFGIYLGINPALRPVLEAGVDRGTFPADLAARLFA